MLPPEKASLDATPHGGGSEEITERGDVTFAGSCVRGLQRFEIRASGHLRYISHDSDMSREMPRVEILFFPGCPNYLETYELVRRVATELGVDPQIELVEVADADAADDQHFLGSPTVRVDGRDVEPGADDRHDYGFSCRVYRSAHGVAPSPDESWIREALAG